MPPSPWCSASSAPLWLRQQPPPIFGSYRHRSVTGEDGQLYICWYEFEAGLAKLKFWFVLDRPEEERC